MIFFSLRVNRLVTQLVLGGSVAVAVGVGDR